MVEGYSRWLWWNSNTIFRDERSNTAVHANIAFEIDQFIMKTFSKFHLLDVTSFQLFIHLVDASNLLDNLESKHIYDILDCIG